MGDKTKSSSSRKAPFYWKPCHNILLLKEVDRVRPWLLPYGTKISQGWTPITETLNDLGIDVDSIRIQKCFSIICEAWGTEQWAGFIRSGHEEEYASRDVLLENIISNLKEFKKGEEMQKEKDKRKREEQLRVGRALQQVCVENLGGKRKSMDGSSEGDSGCGPEDGGLKSLPDFVTGSSKRGKHEAMMVHTMHTMVTESAKAKAKAQEIESNKLEIEKKKWAMEEKEKEQALKAQNEKLQLQQLARDLLLAGNMDGYNNVMKLLATFN